jgi:4-amino-4-deoxy-L-arabinose transferase-like glycosyltransferase
MNTYGKYKSLAILLFLATIILWQNIALPGFFQDGYLYAAFAKNAVNTGQWLVPHLSSATYSEFYQHTPFTFILLGFFFKVFGPSYLVARLFVGLFFIVLLIVHFNFLKREEGEWTAFLNGLFLILLPPLMKKLRFPNMDIPLMLSIYLSLICYYLFLIKNKNKYWLGCGFFFGCSLLIKGPIGLFIPIIIVIHLIVTKKLELLKHVMPWLSLSLGFALFSIWPICLYLNAKYYIFESYLQSTFIHTAYDGRDVEGYSVFTYVIFLAKSSPSWLLLYVYSLKNTFKNIKKNNFYNLAMIASLVFLILFSLMKFKYSHYLIPFYPFYVFVALYEIRDSLKKWQVQIINSVLVLTIILSTLFTIRPMGKITRDPEIYEMLEASKQLKTFPTAVGNVHSIYPFFALANLLAFERGSAVYNVSTDIFMAQVNNLPLDSTVRFDEPNNVNDKTWGIFIQRETYQNLLQKNPEIGSKFSILSYHLTKDMYFVVNKVLIKEDGIVNF